MTFNIAHFSNFEMSVSPHLTVSKFNNCWGRLLEENGKCLIMMNFPLREHQLGFYLIITIFLFPGHKIFQSLLKKKYISQNN